MSFLQLKKRRKLVVEHMLQSVFHTQEELDEIKNSEGFYCWCDEGYYRIEMVPVVDETV